MPTPAARRLRKARFEFQSRDEAAAIAEYVSTLLPESVRVELVLMELMVNAIEHGNLEIKGAKADLVRAGELEAEVARRREDPKYRDRIAWLEVERIANQVTFTIGDAGPGFAWREVTQPSPTTPSGRGLLLARLMSSSGLTFNEAGNVVVVRVEW